MNRFLYAWELGANLGHVGTFEPVAAALTAAGHEVTFAVRETDQCKQLLGDRFLWLQAPIIDEQVRPGIPLNYADILLRFGYDDPVRLRAIVTAWRTLIQGVRPDVILADHAPTAILAARTLGVPVMLFGSSFFCPPRESPFPAMRPWQPSDQAILAGNDEIAMGSINRVLDELDAPPPLRHLYELFDVAETALLTLPELDHYAGRTGASYWGTVNFSGVRAAPQWPESPGPRIFAYLRREHPHFDNAIRTLVAIECSAILYVPDWSDEQVLPPHLSIVGQPAELPLVAAQADVAIVYSGATGASFLLAGKPVLCLPMHLEQYLTCVRIAALGAGIVVSPGQSQSDIAAALQELIGQRAYTKKATEIARKYEQLDQLTVVNNVAARALQLAGSH